MIGKSSRRNFLKTTGSGVTLATFGMNSGCYSEWEPDRENVDQVCRQQINKEMVESEIRRRADFYLTQRHLVVDYYRIRRKLAYPLPVESLSIPQIEVPSIGDYPWAIWMTWELEERINALGWAAEWFGDEAAREAATTDLSALASWPAYRQYEGPDLSSGHAGRILWSACTKWTWVDPRLRNSLVSACRRHVEEVFPASEREYGQINSTADIRALEQPYRKLHNIALIGTIAAALTGSCTEHSGVPTLNHWIQTVFGANLEFRDEGFTEGVAYDGYVLDFIADWLGTLPEERQLPLLRHTALRNFLEESYLLSAPGAAEQVAEIGDVEPKEMPFHVSAQAKLYRLQPDPVRAWHLRRWRSDWMRSAALGCLHAFVDRLEGKAPAGGIANAHYAVVLRSGWERDDLATVVACCNSPMGHLQNDNGTMVVGKAGRWLIADPGYQQYMRGLEREFTLGPTAHNYPVVNGSVQTQKTPRLISLETLSAARQRVQIDLTACYPAAARVRSAVRTVWLSDKDMVIAADQLDVSDLESLQYHWHGHPEASWWCQDGWALIHSDPVDLWLTSPQFAIADNNIERLPASRGQLTLSVETASLPETIWWLFVFADTPEPVRLLEGGKVLEIRNRVFQI